MNTGITDMCTRCLCLRLYAHEVNTLPAGHTSSSCPHLMAAPFLLVHTQNLESLSPAPILPHSTSPSPHPQIPLAELQNLAQCIFHWVWQCSNLSGFAKRQEGLYPLLSSNASLILWKPISTQRPARPSLASPIISSHNQHPFSPPPTTYPLQPYCVPGWSLHLPSVSPSRHLIMLIPSPAPLYPQSVTWPMPSLWNLYSGTSIPVILAPKRLRLQKGVSVWG